MLTKSKLVKIFLILTTTLLFLCIFVNAKDATITIWDFKYGDVGGVQPVMKQIDDLIMKKNPGIKINHVAQPNDNYYQLVRAAVQANEGPDIIMFHGGVQAYEFDPYTVNLDKYIKSWKKEISDYSRNFCSEGGVAGKGVHLVPLTIQGFGIYYNKILFKKAGLDPNKAPSDIASFLKACEALKKAGITPITCGFQGNPFTIDFLFRCLIANIYGKDMAGLGTGKQNFKGNAAFKKAVENVKAIFDNYSDPNGTSTPYFMDGINAFGAGKGGMFVGLLSDVGHWKKFDDEIGKGQVGFMPTINFPEAKNKDLQVLQPCGIGYSVMKWSKNQDEAMKVIEGYARGEGNSIWMAKTGALSPNNKVDIKSLGYPLVGEILKRTFAADVTTLLLNDDANTNMPRYCTQLFVSKEISVDQFIDSYQKMLDNKQNNK